MFTAIVLALGMLGIQFCIGAANDYFDADRDAVGNPGKPIPAGRVSRRAAAGVAVVAAALGFAVPLISGRLDSALMAMLMIMLAAGLGYDMGLKAAGLGWLCFAVAFPFLPLYAWYGAAGALPPRWEVLVPVAFAAGPALHLANSQVDIEADRVLGVRTLSVVLGRRLGMTVMVGLLAGIHMAAWLTGSLDATDLARTLAALAAGLAVAGVILLAMDGRSPRAWGWTLTATSIAVLATAWLIGAA